MAKRYFRPKVMDAIGVTEARALVKMIGLHGKLVGELTGQPARKRRGDLIHDLKGCLALERNPAGVHLWILRTDEDRWRCGYYSLPWTFGALQFLQAPWLGETERSWIQGLLFGYRPEKIQEFIDNGNRVCGITRSRR